MRVPTDRAGQISASFPGGATGHRAAKGSGRSSSVVSAHAPGWNQRHWSSRLLHLVGDVAARSGAGVVAGVLVVAWLVVGAASGFPGWWETVLVVVTGSTTFVMVFVLQHTQERQTAATQRKLDELIHSSATADDTLIAVEAAGDEHLQALAERNLVDRAVAVEGATG